MAAFIARGYVISKPFESSCAYDLIFERKKSGALKKVQIKTGRVRFNGSVIVFNACKNHYRANGIYVREFYGDGAVDYFAVYVHKKRKVYLVPASVVGMKAVVHLRCRKTKNGQDARSLKARKFLFYAFGQP